MQKFLKNKKEERKEDRRRMYRIINHETHVYPPHHRSSNRAFIPQLNHSIKADKGVKKLRNQLEGKK